MLEFEYKNAEIDDNLDLYISLSELIKKEGISKSELTNSINRMSNLLIEMSKSSEKIYNQNLQELVSKESVSLEDELKKLDSLKKIVKSYESIVKKNVEYHKSITDVKVELKIKGINDVKRYEEKIKIIKDYKKRLGKIDELEEKRANAVVDLTATSKTISTSHQTNVEDENHLTNNFDKLFNDDNISNLDAEKVEKEYENAKLLLDNARFITDKAKTSEEEKEASKNLEYSEKEYNECYGLFLKLQLFQENRITSVSDIEYEEKLLRMKGILEKLGQVIPNDKHSVVYKERLSEIDVNINKIRLQKIDVEREKTINKDIETLDADLEKQRKLNNSEKVQKVIGPFVNKKEEVEESIPVIEDVPEENLSNMWQENLEKLNSAIIDDNEIEVVEEPEIVEEEKIESEEPEYNLTSNVVPEGLSTEEIIDSVNGAQNYDNAAGVQNDENETDKANIVKLEEINNLPIAYETVEDVSEPSPEEEIIEQKETKGPMVLDDNPVISITPEELEKLEEIDPNTIVDKNSATTELKMNIFNSREKLKAWWNNMLNKIFATKPHTLTKGGN